MSNPSATPVAALAGLPASFFLIYDNPKGGKTTNLLRAFPDATCIGIKSAIELVAEGTCGFKPSWIIEGVTNLPSLGAMLDWYIAQGYHKTRPRLLIDDLSEIIKVSMVEWKYERPRDGFYAYQQHDYWLITIANKLRASGLILGASCHVEAPKLDKGQVGGPEVGSRGQVQELPGWCDFVARGGMDPNYPDPLWQKTLIVSSDTTQWVTGDRLNIAWEATPANLREIIRAAKGNYNLPRRPGLEWQDEWAQAVCDRVIKDRSPKSIEAIYADVYGHFGAYAAPKTPGELHVQWAIQDGIARAVIHGYHSGGVLGRLRHRIAANALLAPPPPPPGAGAPAGAPPGAPGAPPGAPASNPPPGAPSAPPK